MPRQAALQQAAPRRRSTKRQAGPDPNQQLVLRVIDGAASLLRTTAELPGADTHGSSSVQAVQSFATSMCRVAAHLTEAEQCGRALAAPEMGGLPETTAQLLSQHRSSVRQGRTALDVSVRLGDTLRAAYSNNKVLGAEIEQLLASTDELSAALTAVAPDIDGGDGTAMQRLRREPGEASIVLAAVAEPVAGAEPVAAHRRLPWWTHIEQ